MVLCAIIGIAFKLNQVIIQAVNYGVYPLQLLLLIPFYRTGEKLFGAEPVPILSVAALSDRFKLDPMQFLIDYSLVGLYGIVVWALIAPILFGLAWCMARPLLAQLARPRQTHPSE